MVAYRISIYMFKYPYTYLTKSPIKFRSSSLIMYDLWSLKSIVEYA